MRQDIVDSSAKNFGNIPTATSQAFTDNNPKIEFPGQQTGERVLYRAKMSSKMKILSMVVVVIVALFFLVMFQIVWSILTPTLLEMNASPIFLLLANFLGIALAIFVLWWINRVYDQTELFITDRRVLKFLPLVPYRTSVRTLFWEEVIKVKTFYKNTLLEKMLGIGSFEVHGRNHETDNIEMDYLIYHEDLGNYVDKILYIYKNKPEELTTFKKFVPKPVGKRD